MSNDSGGKSMGMQSRNAIGLFVFASIAFGQSPGAINGTVTDPDKAAVSGAQVEAKNDKGIAFHAKTSAQGAYTIAQLPAGKYEISIAFGGLAPFSKKDVAVAGGETVRIDAQLKDFDSLGSLGEDRTFYSNTFGSHDAPTGPVPRTPAGKPDFSGVWHSLRFTDPESPSAYRGLKSWSRSAMRIMVRILRQASASPTASPWPESSTG